MKQQLKALLALAEVDGEITGLKEIKEARPKQLEPFEEQTHKKSTELKRAKEELKRLRMAGDSTEADIKGKEDKIQKFQVQMNSTKSNEEYQVLKEQISKLKDEVSRQEEEGLEILSKIEKLQHETGRVEEEYEASLKELEAARRETSEELEQIDERLAELAEKRKRAANKVDQEQLQQYDRVLQRHRDRAVAPVENGVCQGCYMSVTPQMVNALMLGEEIVVCKSCQRILYLPE